MQVQSRMNNQQSFGMALRKPNLKGMTASEIAGIREALPELEKIAKNVDIKISRGITSKMESRPSYPYMKEVAAPCYFLEFSKPGNFFTRLFSSIKSNYKSGHTDGSEKTKDVLIKAAENGKQKHREINGLNELDEANKLKAAMKKPKRELDGHGLPRYDAPPPPPREVKGYQPTTELDVKNPPSTKTDAAITREVIEDEDLAAVFTESMNELIAGKK